MRIRNTRARRRMLQRRFPAKPSATEMEAPARQARFPLIQKRQTPALAGVKFCWRENVLGGGSRGSLLLEALAAEDRAPLRGFEGDRSLLATSRAVGLGFDLVV